MMCSFADWSCGLLAGLDFYWLCFEPGECSCSINTNPYCSSAVCRWILPIVLDCLADLTSCAQCPATCIGFKGQTTQILLTGGTRSIRFG